MPDTPVKTQNMSPAAHLTSVIGQGTEKLYYEDAYMREFDAIVRECRELASGGGTASGPAGAASVYAIILDRTAFFPEEGGQSPDRGFLYIQENYTDVYTGKDAETAEYSGGIPVGDVQIRGGVITHFTAAPIPEGTPVHGVLDFHHRFSNMQQHSAEHLYSGLVYERFGWANTGFHLSDTEVTMDYSGPLTPEEATELELEVNRRIWADIESRQEFPAADELQNMAYRSKAEIDGVVRLVTFPDCDTCACCAPHVARTGEIGLFKIISLQNYKGGVRIHMLAGERAFRHLSAEHGYLNTVARMFSTSPEQVPGRVEKLRSDIADVRYALTGAESALLEMQAAAVPAEQENVCLFTQGLPDPVIRKTINRLMEVHAGVSGVFDGSDEAGYRYIIGSAGDVAGMQQKLREHFGARGGGRPPLMQGSLQASAEQIRELFCPS